MRDFKASLLLYAMLCLQVTDWMETVYMLGLGGIEANPLMRQLFFISPYLALIPKLAAVSFAFVCYMKTRQHKHVLVMLAVPTVLSGIPVAWNLAQLWAAGYLGG